MTVPTLCQTVLECPHPRALAEFYRRLLNLTYAPGSEPEHPETDEPDWLVLRSPDTSAQLAFQRVDTHTAPTWPHGPVPQQLHLDLKVATVSDLDEQHERVLALGGTLLSDRTNVGPDEPFRVYADPAGHPFCIFVAD